jgi:hypothetical protein
MRPTLLCLSLLLPLVGQAAEIYKYIDANGKTVFTSQPPDGRTAQPVQLPPTNTVKMEAPGNPPPPASTAAPSQPAYATLQIGNLPPGNAIRANDGNFSVSADIQPGLQPGHQLQLIVDGTPYGAPTTDPVFQLTNMDRGGHSLSLAVVAGDQLVQQSPPVTVYVLRAIAR